ncbi:methylmalonyl-CoA epimerase [Halobellus limi]|uniref:Methylmalonyl-CoA epimerase n=1 Tax=Halobellus limi TaxID=699433 RepID=A0A1H5ZQB6_9EURY|nr:methylmalonyl-CoA epimerase [Halobellus limi]QCC48935.1 methylmalonyl-CoA epimerase [Halobellus limi]SEG38708.1 methylmalonyl-CoA epimerase [Halobellus limi]
MTVAFDHLGVATTDGADLAATFETLFDAPVVHEETFEGMAIRFLDLGGGYFELLEPADGGAIARFLDRQGPGVHHVALRTDDVAAALDRARNAGVDLVDEEPRPGAWGHEVAFLHPKSTGGVLVEYVEHAGEG